MTVSRPARRRISPWPMKCCHDTKEVQSDK
jgi:hypothetical protein